jgi:protein TonB
MFDLVAGATEHIPRRPAVPVLISLTTEIALVAGLGFVSVLVGVRQLPETPTMFAFVAAPPAALPPPPPPPPATPATEARRNSNAARATEAPRTTTPAPIEAPSVLPSEFPAGEEDAGEGVPGGIEGGVAGGGEGVAGSEPPPLAPPAPAAPPPAPPIRVGGKVPQPELLHRVEPEYPRAAVDARIQGVVILETVVAEDGHVIDVRVLRSAGEAIRQWRYAPLELNGTRVRFLLTATLSFKLTA